MSSDQPITLRPVTPADQPFLYTVYASTRAAELAALPWSDNEKTAFLQMQFMAQDNYYRQHYRQPVFAAVLLAGEPVGRFYVERSPEAICVIDIALLPAYRNQGIGSTLLRNLLHEGAQAQVPVQLHVEIFNPAQRLYTRLGFVPTGESGIYRAMQWQP